MKCIHILKKQFLLLWESLHRLSCHDVTFAEWKQVTTAVKIQDVHLYRAVLQFYTVRSLQLSSLGNLGSLTSCYNYHQDCSQICLKSVIMLLSWVLSVSWWDTVTDNQCVSLTVLSERFQSGTVCAVRFCVTSAKEEQGVLCVFVLFICTLLYLNITKRSSYLIFPCQFGQLVISLWSPKHTLNILSKQDATHKTWSIYLPPHKATDNINFKLIWWYTVIKSYIMFNYL